MPGITAPDTKTYEDVIRVIDDKQIPVEHP